VDDVDQGGTISRSTGLDLLSAARHHTMKT
jgi:hypothetical protein